VIYKRYVTMEDRLRFVISSSKGRHVLDSNAHWGLTKVQVSWSDDSSQIGLLMCSGRSPRFVGFVAATGDRMEEESVVQLISDASGLTSTDIESSRATLSKLADCRNKAR